MKKFVISAMAVGMLFAQTDNTDLQKQIEELKAKLQKVEKMAIQNQKKVNPIAANSHLFFSYDLKTSFDFIKYKMNKAANEDILTNNIFSNRITLTGVAKPADNLKATLVLQANAIFGMNSELQYSPFNNISWVANETPDDLNLRIKQAFFNYYFGPDNGLMFSAGRRPATGGFPANLRTNDAPASPLAHLINMEFDGFSLEISNTIFSNMSDSFSDWGTWIKFCAGRGYSSSKGKWPADGSPAYTKDDLGITDFAGMIFVPYDDGQYSLWIENVWAWNLKGYVDTNGDGIPDTMQDVGDYYGLDVTARANGIGEDLGDFFDNTTAFVSFALSQTYPDSGKRMLGKTDDKTGYSWWIGAQMPGFSDTDTWGFNYVWGNKYWRSMTYGEDTLIGSIAAVRGNAYDIYYHHQIQPHLTTGIRLTYIDYKYTGSDAFFGDDGMPVDVDDALFPAADKAYDIHAYIRYNF